MAFRLKVSPWITEYGSDRSTKKGWKTLRVVRGENPKPVSATQKVLAFHSVMVSGTATWRDTCPLSLQQEEREENLLRSSQKSPGVSLWKEGRACYQPDGDQIPNPGLWKKCPWLWRLLVIRGKCRTTMADMTVCQKASDTSENSVYVATGEISSSFTGNLTQTVNAL